MRRSIVLLALLTACAGTGAATTTTESPGGDSVGTVSPDTDTTVTGGTSDSTAGSEGTTTTDSGRERAPDFTLQLGEGGSYTLSEGAKPVYMIFWAEW